MEILLLIAVVAVGGFFIYNMLQEKPATKADTQPAETPKAEPAKEEVQPVTENKVDPVSVALDLEPVAIAEPAKTRGRKPKNPLDVNQDGKVNLADVKEAVKKTKAKAKTVTAKAKAVTSKATKSAKSAKASKTRSKKA